MKKKVLIIRNAREIIFNEIVSDLKEEYEIYCLIQKEEYKNYTLKYNYIRFIDLKRNGFYRYCEYDNKKLINIQFHKVFTLSGNKFFSNQSEFYKLLYNNNVLNKLFGYNIYGEYIYLGTRYNRLKYRSEFWSNFFNFLDYFFYKYFN